VKSATMADVVDGIEYAVANGAQLINASWGLPEQSLALQEAIQEAAITALTADQHCVVEMCDIYRQRRDLMVDFLRQAGFVVTAPLATFYLWIKNPPGMDSASVASMLLEEAGVVVTPGNGFGEAGEGYFRISLTVPEARLQEAGERIIKAIG